MVLQILLIIAPVVACAAVGFIWARIRRPYETTFVTRLIMNVGAPCLILDSFQSVQTDLATIGRVGLAAAGVTVLVCAAGVLALRAFRLNLRTYLPPVIFQNTGNMGLPICLFAFGPEGMTLAIVVMVWVFSLNFSVGVAIASGERNLLRILRTPLVWATLLAVGLLLGGVTLPGWVNRTVELLAGLTIPLMLITLGVSLGMLRVQSLPRSILVATFRFVFGFAAGWAVCALLDLTGVARGVVMLQATMPPAVFNYLLAARYDRDAADVAGVVVIGTIMSAGVLPLVLWLVL